MLSRSNWLILGLAVAAAAAGGYIQHRWVAPPVANEPPPSPMVGQPLPALSLPDLDGKLHSLEEYRGRRVLLNFWASWCAPCVEEMPALDAAQEKFGENAPIVLGIALDESANVTKFLQAHPVRYPILLGDVGPPSTAEKLGNSRRTLPFSILIDENGRILATHDGILSAQQLQQWFSPSSTRR